MILLVDFKLFITEGSRWIQVVEFAVFAYACYRLWKQTNGLSAGHSYLGQLSIICLFADLLILLFAPERLTLFRTIQYVPLTTWLLYNDSYFKRYPIPKRTIDQSAVDPLDDKEVKPLINHLYDQTTRQPFFLTRQFQHASIWAVLGLTLLYGFSRTINAFEWGFVYGANERKKATVETKKAVTTAVQSASAAFAKEVAPIVKKGAIDSAILKAALENRSLLREQSKPLPTTRKKTGPVKLTQSVQKIQPTKVKPLSSTGFAIPAQAVLFNVSPANHLASHD